jgi:DNA polymerase-3 subunit beta
MKLSCSQKDLLQGLNTIKRAVATRSTLPVLSNALLATDGERLKLAATDLEIGINCWVSAQVESEGATTVPATTLADLVNALSPDQINLELDDAKETLKLQCQKTKANFKGIPAEEFPVIPVAKNIVPIDENLFREIVTQVSIAAASDESRPILTGILVKSEQEQLTMAAADGFRLSTRSAKLNFGQDDSLIVPASSLKEAARLGVTGIDIRDNQVIFQGRDNNLVSQLIEGNFPDFEQIIPKEFATSVVVDTQSFLLACKKAQVFARESANIVTLEVVPDFDITILARSAELGDSQDVVPATVTGEPVTIGMNVKYLVEALSVIPSENTMLRMNGATSPILLEPDNPELGLRMVIMPMHLGE